MDKQVYKYSTIHTSYSKLAKNQRKLPNTDLGPHDTTGSLSAYLTSFETCVIQELQSNLDKPIGRL